ncbi:hypothetical protein V1512DRAFT_290959 [Lipomyces arxii]|uniref:uncharacterized protein n=1 Tax=Lipomyces arxii TaxID=56418 RepID=UPI0034CE68D2
MEPSRANSPAVQSSNELYDHRNQPETLPIRISFSDGTSPTNGIHVSTGSAGSATGGRPQFGATLVPELAVYEHNSDVEFDNEHDLDRLEPSVNIVQRASARPTRSGGSVSITMEPDHRDDVNNPFEYGTSPTSGHHLARTLSGNNNPAAPVTPASGPSRGRRSRRQSLEPGLVRRPTFTDVQIESPVDGNVKVKEKEADNASARGVESDSDSEARSRVNSEDETEEDVCFPMHLEHQRINGIDFDELEEFSAAQRLEQWYPSLTRRSDNDLGLHGRRMTFTPGTLPNRQAAMRPSMEIGKTEVGTTVASLSVPSSQTMTDDEKVVGTTDEVEILKAQTLPPEVAARFAEADDRFSLFCSESEETIHAPEICLLTGPGQTFANLFDKSNGTWWLDCMDPTDAEMKMLAKTFGIHPLTTEDIRVQETREKVELFRSYYFVCFRTFNNNKSSEEFLEPLNMYMVVFRDGILSFHFSGFQHTANVRRRIRQLRDYVTVSADWICYALIDDIVDGFAPVIHEIEQEADGIEDSVFVARESDFGDMLKRIGESRKTVMTLMRLLSGKADVIKMFAKRCNEQWDVAPKGEIGLYLGDIQDHIVTMYQNLSAYEKILSRSHANYLAQLQVESFHANNRVTDMLSKVTLLGTVLVPLNLITGLFGMNVTVPGEATGSLGWFFGIVGVLALFVIVLVFVARMWLGKEKKRID